MQFVAQNLKLKKLMDGNTEIVLEILDKQNKLFTQIKSEKELLDNSVDVTLDKLRKRRSANHNRLFWDMCNCLAEHIEDPTITALAIYKDLIKEYGISVIYPVPDDFVEFSITNWESRGMGWITEVLRKSKLDGNYTNVCFWYGSSIYNSKQFWRLVEGLKLLCKDYDLDISHYDQAMQSALKKLEQREAQHAQKQA